MKDSIKALVRKSLNFLHLDLSKNLEYDRLTSKIISKTVTTNSTCVDIGAHKGEILDLFLKYAPDQKHFAFEPIPALFENLKKKYASSCKVLSVALSDSQGETTFQYVKNAPAYSGIKQRKYDIKNPEIEEIDVHLDRLDSILDENQKIDFIKIDVEGAELSVLKGAKNTIYTYRPFVLFECGLGASDFYGTQAEEVFDFFSEADMRISTLKGWLQNEKTLTKELFCQHFTNNSEYYFLAHS